ncbi:uncharacterized protein LOC129788376 [Lutzomyia longipalpis]|uniref:uncharacterized protein LOC129788376 n=1 Tax=Lutzomyia longipalpis TaxID=7200 RepID=UPI0024841C19|nr:uncharacterized protein LOC129788376 [Lutzomyia longipalpis]
MIIREVEIHGLPGFPVDTKYFLARNLSILHGRDRMKLKRILQSIQFVVDPLLGSLSVSAKDVANVKDDAFIQVLVEVEFRSYTLRRNLKDPSLCFINKKSASVEEFYRIIADVSFSVQTCHFDGELLAAFAEFTEKNWLNWLKVHLNLIESLDEEFGSVLDTSECLKRHTSSILMYTAEKIKHLSRCVEIERNVEALKAVKADRGLSSAKFMIEEVKKAKFMLLRQIRGQDREFLKMQLERYEIENAIFFTESEKNLAEVYLHLSSEISLDEPARDGGGEIDELNTLLRKLVSGSQEIIEKITSEAVVPNKESVKFKGDYLKLCLHLSWIATAIEQDDSAGSDEPEDVPDTVEEYRKLINVLKRNKEEARADLTMCKNKVLGIWDTMMTQWPLYVSHIAAFERNQKAFTDNVTQINGLLNTFYRMHLKMTDLLTKEEQCANEMTNLRFLLDIDKEILSGVDYIEWKVASLAAENKLPFPPENYHGPLFRYLCFTRETPPLVVHKFTHILKPLYTVILVESKDDAKKLMDMSRELLREEKIVLNILPLELFDCDRNFSEDALEELQPMVKAIYENLCENKFTNAKDRFRREIFRNMLKRILFSEITEKHEGLILVNREGDIVADGFLSGGSYATQPYSMPELLRKYCALGLRGRDLRIEKESLLVDIEDCREELEMDRKQLIQKESLTFNIDLVREISKHLLELRHKMRDVATAKRCLQKITDDLEITRDALKLLENKTIQSKEYYENELDALQRSISAQPDISYDEDLEKQIRKLYAGVDHLDHLANAMDWKFNWYSSGATFQSALFKSEYKNPELALFDEKKEEFVAELDELDVKYSEMKSTRESMEKLKHSLSIQLATSEEILQKCSMAQKKHHTVPQRDKAMYEDLSMAEISEHLTHETEKFMQLTGYGHVYKINDVVKLKLSRWNNRLRNLTGKCQQMSSTVHNEALIWSDHRFAIRQLTTFLSILREVKFSRPNGQLFHFSFLLKKTTGHWIDCNPNNSSKVSTYNASCAMQHNYNIF